jgi:hypothetical protein
MHHTGYSGLLREFSDEHKVEEVFINIAVHHNIFVVGAKFKSNRLCEKCKGIMSQVKEQLKLKRLW